MKTKLDKMGAPLKKYFVREEDYERYKQSAKPGEFFVVNQEFFEPGCRLVEVPGYIQGSLMRVAAALVSEEDFLPVGSKVESDEL